MVKRLSKSRRSSILEHLLALEKQIRAELGGDGFDGHRPQPIRTKGTRALPTIRRGQHESDDQDLAPPEFIARSTH
jgi:hypothetical protein